jgi:acylphosphatase
VTARIVVSGRVQGVGFRYYTARRAEEFGVRGSVWNRRDGSVEILARAPDAARMTLFENSLRLGPGSVSAISLIITKDEVAGEGFVIDHARNA